MKQALKNALQKIKDQEYDDRRDIKHSKRRNDSSKRLQYWIRDLHHESRESIIRARDPRQDDADYDQDRVNTKKSIQQNTVH